MPRIGWVWPLIAGGGGDFVACSAFVCRNCRKAPNKTTPQNHKEETRMKKTKALLTLACAVLLVAASVMGTMAYLTSTASVNNTFTVGNVKLGGDNEAGLDEALVNENGQPIDNDTDKNVVEKANAPRVTENDYKLQPGHTYVKDPTIHVADDSDNCFLFVKVENGISAIEDSTNNIAAQMAAKGWKALGEGYANIYVYVGTDEGATNPLAVSAGADVTVFDQFKVAGTVTNDTLKDYASKEIKVTAYAVQVDGFESKTAVEIWNAAFGSTTSDTDA